MGQWEVEVEHSQTKASPNSGRDGTSVRSNRRGDIQGLRALAVIFVIAFHSGLPTPGGFVGVDVFFVISGFVITGLLRREFARTGSIKFGRFYFRRFKRLTPALALMVSAVLLASALILSPFGPQQVTSATGAGAMLLIANFVIALTTGGYFDAAAETNPLLNTWSLSVEEQFYLFFPAVIALGSVIAVRVKRARFAPFLIVVGVGLVSLSIAMATASGWAPPRGTWLVGFYSPASRSWEFAAGALLALAVERYPARSLRAASISGAVGCSLLAASLWLISGDTPFPGPWTVLPVAATAVLLYAGTLDANPISRALSTPFLVRIGDWSYSLYLWHWPLIVFASFLWPGNRVAVLAAATLSIVPALASFRWVEQRYRARGSLSTVAAIRLVSICLCGPLILAGLLGVSGNRMAGSQSISTLAAAIETPHLAELFGCDALPPSVRDERNCEWNADSGGAPIYLVGDSNAGQFSEGLVDAGATLARPVSIGTSTGCPLVDSPYARVDRPASLTKACRDWVDETMRWLKTAEPGTVVLALSQRWWSDPGLKPESMEERLSAESPASFMESSLISTVSQLRAAGHEVLLVQSMPHFGESLPWPVEQPFDWDPMQCALWVVLNGRCEKSMPREYVDQSQETSRASLMRIGVATGARIVDPSRAFCSDSSCGTQFQGLSVYSDRSHISVAASGALAALFEDALREYPGIVRRDARVVTGTRAREVAE